jgi:hypothetical protein
MRNKLSPIAVVGLAVPLLLCAGCYKYAYVTGLKPTGQEITQWQNITAWGWDEPEPVYLDKMCPGPVAEFGSYISFPNWLCTFFTLGFWSPQTIYVMPAAGESKTRPASSTRGTSSRKRPGF